MSPWAPSLAMAGFAQKLPHFSGGRVFTAFPPGSAGVSPSRELIPFAVFGMRTWVRTARKFLAQSGFQSPGCRTWRNAKALEEPPVSPLHKAVSSGSSRCIAIFKMTAIG